MKNALTRSFAFAWLLSLKAAAATSAEAVGVEPVSSFGASLVRVLGALALVFAIFFAGIWLLRNWQRLLVKRGVASKLRIVEAKSLGQRQTIFVVGYENQRMLIASSPTGVTLLAPLPPAESEPAAVAGPPPAFSEILRKVWSGK